MGFSVIFTKNTAQFRKNPRKLFYLTYDRKLCHFLLRYIIWDTQKYSPKDLGKKRIFRARIAHS